MQPCMLTCCQATLKHARALGSDVEMEGSVLIWNLKLNVAGLFHFPCKKALTPGKHPFLLPFALARFLNRRLRSRVGMVVNTVASQRKGPELNLWISHWIFLCGVCMTILALGFLLVLWFSPMVQNTLSWTYVRVCFCDSVCPVVLPATASSLKRQDGLPFLPPL